MTDQRYKTIRVVTHFPLYRVVDTDAGGLEPYFLDSYRTRSAADYAARLLNRGLAQINPHATIGCRVEARNV